MPDRRTSWTPERRAAQRERILNQKPWEHSKGPRTRKGKERAALNALKHAHYSTEFKNLSRMLNLYGLFLDDYDALLHSIDEYMTKNIIANELKKNRDFSKA